MQPKPTARSISHGLLAFLLLLLSPFAQANVLTGTVTFAGQSDWLTHSLDA